MIYFFRRQDKTGAWILGFGVTSHWLLDFITHRSDLPIAPGLQTYVGLGLWNSVGATILVESALFIFAVVLYARTTTPLNRTGRYAFWVFVGFCILVYTGNVMSRHQTPPNVTALAIGGLSQWLIIPWAYWIDRHRVFKRAS